MLPEVRSTIRRFDAGRNSKIARNKQEKAIGVVFFYLFHGLGKITLSFVLLEKGYFELLQTLEPFCSYTVK